ncbi:hypothetical protein Gohar_012897 [Gossypium harknessii]|uniref:ENT domain-containing protein n=1 Tax=Gossypium harknessii TaxID=34285 RepID=A0A7J9GZ64_9ROSI|nr:hypothetical protein [Gossypium harknessii]
MILILFSFYYFYPGLSLDNMKFKQGNLVEVLRREHDPYGSWFTGNIISADGDNYIVRYKLLVDHEEKRVAEKVRGMDVRPLPPSVNGKRWAVGDIAEVFDTQCWRVAKVAKVLNNSSRFVIKFFGSIQLREFHASSLRIRQAWHDNKWIVIGKVAENFTPKTPYRAGGLRFRTSLHFSTTMQSKARYKEGEHNNGEAHNITKWLSMRAKSKGSAHQYEEYNMDPLFGRTFKKRKPSLYSRGCDGKRTLPSYKQVDISCSHVAVDENFIKQSTNRNSRMEGKIPRCLYDSSTPVWSTEDNDQCSVASCSFNGDCVIPFSHKPMDNTPNNSDAESAFPSLCGKRDLPLPPVNKVYYIHELELRAYKSTMEALFASGPLSWEQETLLTNLRLSLKISDEEHLLQLRHLLSAQVL